MKTEQKKWEKNKGWENISSNNLNNKAQLVLAFGGTDIIDDKKIFNDIKSFYPKANIVICSTAGEILGTNVSDDTIVLTAMYFEKTKLQFGETDIKKSEESFECGKKLIDSLNKKGLCHVMIFSDGLKINGSELVRGLDDNLPEKVAVTGGLVGDGSRFKKTLVGLNSPPVEGKIVIIGFYSKDLKVSYGSLGGWDPFGPERVITKSKNNILYELDGKPALKLYKEYLGDQAKGLPGTGLLFPLNVRMKSEDGEIEVVRTILAVNEKDYSMTFAGNMPEGAYAKLMKANFDRLIDGAAGAASMIKKKMGESQPNLAILISCVGRKLVLKDRTEEEIESVRDVLGSEVAIIGFYSYGEISPIKPQDTKCRLHNQTMTITTFKE